MPECAGAPASRSGRRDVGGSDAPEAHRDQRVTIEPWILGFLVVVYLGGSIINGLIGMGLALVAVVAVASTIDPKAGVVIQSLVAPFLSSYQLIHNRAHLKGWGRLRTLILWAVVGSIIGAQLLVLLPSWAIALALGGFTIQFIIDRLRQDRPALATTAERRLAPIAGLIGGTTNSTLGASGPIIGSYLYAIGLRGREFALAISVVFLITALIRVGSLAVLGQYTVQFAILSAILLVPALVGQHIGQRLQGRVDPVLFRRVLLSVLLVSSFNLFVQGGRGLLAFLGVRF
jgi:uncharacterized membrane protein YfcA